MSLEQQLAEQMVNENNRLKGENQELLDLNESMNIAMQRIEALGGIDAIEAKINQINESRTLEEGEEEILESFTNIVENFGGLEVIEESLTKHNEFVEKHGSLEDVSEALATSKVHLNALADFVAVHGTLDEVSESMSALEQRMPAIEEGLKSANQAEEFFAQYGSPEEISEALTRASALLGAQVEKINEGKLAEVCESYGITAEKASELMDKHSLDLAGLGDLCESLGMKPAEEQSQENIEESLAPSTKRGAGLMGSLVNGSRFLSGSADTDISESKEEKKPQSGYTSRFARMV